MPYSTLATLLSKQVLTGENYVQWKTNINLLLTCYNYQFVLAEKCPPDPGMITSKTALEAHNRWINANSTVRAYLLASMVEPLRARLERLETAHEIMESLEEMCSQPCFESCYESVKAVVNTRMGPGASVRAHVLSMMRHFSVAKSNGVIVDQATQVRMILETLPLGFFPFKLDYVSKKKVYDLGKLLHELENFESCICSKNYNLSIVDQSSSSPAPLENKNKKRKFNGDHVDGLNTLSNKIDSNVGCKKSKQAEKSPKGICFHCGVDGHWKRNCPLYIAELKEKKGENG